MSEIVTGSNLKVSLRDNTNFMPIMKHWNSTPDCEVNIDFIFLLWKTISLKCNDQLLISCALTILREDYSYILEAAKESHRTSTVLCPFPIKSLYKGV